MDPSIQTQVSLSSTFEDWEGLYQEVLDKELQVAAVLADSRSPFHPTSARSPGALLAAQQHTYGASQLPAPGLLQAQHRVSTPSPLSELLKEAIPTDTQWGRLAFREPWRIAATRVESSGSDHTHGDTPGSAQPPNAPAHSHTSNHATRSRQRRASLSPPPEPQYITSGWHWSPQDQNGKYVSPADGDLCQGDSGGGRYEGSSSLQRGQYCAPHASYAAGYPLSQAEAAALLFAGGSPGRVRLFGPRAGRRSDPHKQAPPVASTASQPPTLRSWATHDVPPQALTPLPPAAHHSPTISRAAAAHHTTPVHDPFKGRSVSDGHLGVLNSTQYASGTAQDGPEEAYGLEGEQGCQWPAEYTEQCRGPWEYVSSHRKHVTKAVAPVAEVAKMDLFISPRRYRAFARVAGGAAAMRQSRPAAGARRRASHAPRSPPRAVRLPRRVRLAGVGTRSRSCSPQRTRHPTHNHLPTNPLVQAGVAAQELWGLHNPELRASIDTLQSLELRQYTEALQTPSSGSVSPVVSPREPVHDLGQVWAEQQHGSTSGHTHAAHQSEGAAQYHGRNAPPHNSHAYHRQHSSLTEYSRADSLTNLTIQILSDGGSPHQRTGSDPSPCTGRSTTQSSHCTLALTVRDLLTSSVHADTPTSPTHSMDLAPEQWDLPGVTHGVCARGRGSARGFLGDGVGGTLPIACGSVAGADVGGQGTGVLHSGVGGQGSFAGATIGRGEALKAPWDQGTRASHSAGARQGSFGGACGDGGSDVQALTLAIRAASAAARNYQALLESIATTSPPAPAAPDTDPFTSTDVQGPWPRASDTGGVDDRASLDSRLYREAEAVRQASVPDLPLWPAAEPARTASGAGAPAVKVSPRPKRRAPPPPADSPTRPKLPHVKQKSFSAALGAVQRGPPQAGRCSADGAAGAAAAPDTHTELGCELSLGVPASAVSPQSHHTHDLGSVASLPQTTVQDNATLPGTVEDHAACAVACESVGPEVAAHAWALAEAHASLEGSQAEHGDSGPEPVGSPPPFTALLHESGASQPAAAAQLECSSHAADSSAHSTACEAPQPVAAESSGTSQPAATVQDALTVQQCMHEPSDRHAECMGSHEPACADLLHGGQAAGGPHGAAWEGTVAAAKSNYGVQSVVSTATDNVAGSHQGCEAHNRTSARQDNVPAVVAAAAAAPQHNPPAASQGCGTGTAVTAAAAAPQHSLPAATVAAAAPQQEPSALPASGEGCCVSQHAEGTRPEAAGCDTTCSAEAVGEAAGSSSVPYASSGAVACAQPMGAAQLWVCTAMGDGASNRGMACASSGAVACAEPMGDGAAMGAMGDGAGSGGVAEARPGGADVCDRVVCGAEWVAEWTQGSQTAAGQSPFMAAATAAAAAVPLAVDPAAPPAADMAAAPAVDMAAPPAVDMAAAPAVNMAAIPAVNMTAIPAVDMAAPPAVDPAAPPAAGSAAGTAVDSPPPAATSPDSTPSRSHRSPSRANMRQANEVIAEIRALRAALPPGLMVQLAAALAAPSADLSCLDVPMLQLQRLAELLGQLRTLLPSGGSPAKAKSVTTQLVTLQGHLTSWAMPVLGPLGLLTYDEQSSADAATASPRSHRAARVAIDPQRTAAAASATSVTRHTRATPATVDVTSPPLLPPPVTGSSEPSTPKTSGRPGVVTVGGNSNSFSFSPGAALPLLSDAGHATDTTPSSPALSQGSPARIYDAPAISMSPRHASHAPNAGEARLTMYENPASAASPKGQPLGDMHAEMAGAHHVHASSAGSGISAVWPSPVGVPGPGQQPGQPILAGMTLLEMAAVLNSRTLQQQQLGGHAQQGEQWHTDTLSTATVDAARLQPQNPFLTQQQLGDSSAVRTEGSHSRGDSAGGTLTTSKSLKARLRNIFSSSSPGWASSKNTRVRR